MPIIRTINAKVHAMTHCIKITTAADFLEPISLLMEEIAATHGVYSKVNTKNIRAVKGVNNEANEAEPSPINTVNVLTTLSFAVKPAINAVETFQSPNPRGVNIGEINPPIIANMLF